MGNSVSLCVNDVTLHLAAFASEESDQILLGQTVVVVRQTPHRLVLLDTFDVEGAPEMAHHCRIEGDLTKFAAGVRVRLKKDIRVRLNEDPDRQFTRTEQNLCGGFVLPIKQQNPLIRFYSNGNGTGIRWELCTPPKSRKAAVAKNRRKR